MNRPILLIEDDQWLADSLLVVLRSRGHDVAQFSSAHEAMGWIDENRPSLIIADVMLGDHNTFGLFHELQSYADTAPIPVIICTSLGAESMGGVDLESYGVVEVLDKTVLTPDRLVLAVETHLPEQRGVDQ